jgi:predicted outer membrane protein
MNNILDFWREFTLVFGAIATFMFGRKSAKISEKKQEIDAVDSTRVMYNNFVIDYNIQYENLTNRLNALELRNALLTESAETWEKKFKVLEKQHETLKKQFESYKLNHK